MNEQTTGLLQTTKKGDRNFKKLQKMIMLRRSITKATDLRDYLGMSFLTPSKKAKKPLSMEKL